MATLNWELTSYKRGTLNGRAQRHLTIIHRRGGEQWWGYLPSREARR